jgi:sterol desaturase/sphingolipid hydroxylase (fatty acid hydroxylase superfamily)
MVDLSLAAIPFYFASMGAEAAWHRDRRSAGIESAGDYERNDTLTSLAMGVGSLAVPLATKPLMKRFELGAGRWVRPALAVTAGAALTAVAADAIARAQGLTPGTLPEVPRSEEPEPESGSRATRRARIGRLAKRVGGSAAVAAIAGAGAVVAGTWANRTAAQRLWQRRVLPDWGNGPAAALAAVFAWDAIYYWNHRIQHEARYLWAIHVVHHSSEHYNLSTALRQPVADSLGTFVPYGLMALLGIRPALIEAARGINLVYQYWIHTEAIAKLGPLEKVLNTPSHHRVHHGSNRQYLDRNHGSILIVWDKLFGTFEPEDEPVRYGLTKNIDTFNPLLVASHEYLDIADDVARSQNWADRVGFVVRGPGWAAERRAEMAGV